MPDGSQATLKGTIRAKDGSALPGVTLTVAGLTAPAVEIANTGADGGYEVGSLMPGKYLITVQMPGFEDAEQEADVEAPETVVDFTLSLRFGR